MMKQFKSNLVIKTGGEILLQEGNVNTYRSIATVTNVLQSIEES